MCHLLQLDKMVSHVNEILPVTFMGEDEYEDESEDVQPRLVSAHLVRTPAAA